MFDIKVNKKTFMQILFWETRSPDEDITNSWGL